MNARILKYQIPIGSDVGIDVPPESQVVAAAMQHGHPTLWIRAKGALVLDRRTFRIVGTGAKHPASWQHVGTVFDDPLVWHIMEVL